MVNGKGPEKSLRREATKVGCPTIILEAGEPRKIEPSVLEAGVRGVKNALKSLGMLPGQPMKASYQVRVDKAAWVRAEVGGILHFHVAPGDPVDVGQPIATNVSVFGQEQTVVISPVEGIILGMTTLPAVKPGEPICQIAIPNKALKTFRRALAEADADSLHHRLRADLATNINVSECEGDWASDAITEVD
jgi:predicted deacylase